MINIYSFQLIYIKIFVIEKVLTTQKRLRDTLVHEMCHAAVWLINNVNEGHGPLFYAWGRKSVEAHPELPLITRCHSYDIECKYTYECTKLVFIFLL